MQQRLQLHGESDVTMLMLFSKVSKLFLKLATCCMVLQIRSNKLVILLQLLESSGNAAEICEHLLLKVLLFFLLQGPCKLSHAGQVVPAVVQNIVKIQNEWSC